ncbi:MAG: CBS domain-containing protein [Bdellovibrionia bacterium]
MPMQAKQTMSEGLITAYMMDTLATVAEQMKKHNIRHMPVLDDGGNVVGIVSDRDIQRATWPVESPGDNYREERPVFRPSAVVSDYMSWPIKTVTSDTGLNDVAQMMIKEKISAVLVTKSQRLVGIVTHEDLLKVLLSLLKPPESRVELLKRWAYDSPIGQIATSLSEIGL